MLDHGSNSDRRLGAGDVVVQAVSLPAGAAAALTSEICRAGLAHWRGLRQDAPLPDREVLDPSGMLRLLPYTFLIDVLDGGNDFRYRLVGTNIVAHTPRDNTGLRLSEIEAQGTQRQLRALYGSAVAGRQPRFQRIAYRTRAGMRSWYETVACPLLERGSGPGIRLLVGWAEHFHQPVAGGGPA